MKPRPVSLFTGQWADLTCETMVQKAKEFGYDGLELACWGDHFEVDKADAAYCAAKRELLEKAGMNYCRLNLASASYPDPILTIAIDDETTENSQGYEYLIFVNRALLESYLELYRYNQHLAEIGRLLWRDINYRNEPNWLSQLIKWSNDRQVVFQLATKQAIRERSQRILCVLKKFWLRLGIFAQKQSSAEKFMSMVFGKQAQTASLQINTAREIFRFQH